MANKFCQHCGTQILAEAKFCASCGQAQAVTAPAGAGEQVHAFASAPTAGSNKKTIFIAAGAAIVAIAIGVVFFIVKPGAGASLNGKTGQEILAILVDDGYCHPSSDKPSGYYMQLCITPESDGIFLYGELSSSDIGEEVNLNVGVGDRYAKGADWLIVVRPDSDLIEEIAKKYGGEIGTK